MTSPGEGEDASAARRALATDRRPPIVAADRVRWGVAAGVGTACAYGVTVVIGRSLARAGWAGQPVLAWRFGLGALVLMGVQRARRAPLRPAPGERLRVPLLGAIYMVESTLTFAALGRGTAGAVGLVFYVYPALVAAVEVARRRVRLSIRLVGAQVLSVGGVLTVTVVGAAELSLTRTAALLALGGAMAFTLYLLAGDLLVHRTDAVARAAWTSGTAAVAQAATALVAGLTWPDLGRASALLAYGLANAAAFGLMFAALIRIGPTRTAVLLNVEAVTTVALAALFLGEVVAPLQLLGGLAVLSGSVLVTLSREPPSGAGP
jgi:drug/metabolite transporter (DMT)-like permease